MELIKRICKNCNKDFGDEIMNGWEEARDYCQSCVCEVM